MGSGAFPIGVLARRSGCTVETIRYYERAGLLPAPPRRGAYRSYGEEDVRRLRFIRRARQLGFTLEEVRALLRLAAGGHASCGEARALAAAHLADVRGRIADLRRMAEALSDAVRACEAGDPSGCPLIETLHGAEATALTRS
ncbi:MerR family transcriptional regulator [Elioraea sp. Yellowstone]|jgi:MerR family mercuric resistance operon transcriptional regulator|uniref:MerR family DNA-binding protein n=1 Tax=Elioraea sp. Yellowstone TaxID=2592070 RepID=UPI00114FBFA5|nr:MerR family DNA-binding protein [Elioraea sp. Yellowstone]TQF77648.1 MerR family transcriptional regulator [Elioraea sp. Yellowstone]